MPVCYPQSLLVDKSQQHTQSFVISSIMMELPEASTHSFVIRVWLEETADNAEQPKWRGHVTHVPGNQRRYFDNLEDIKHIVKSYLERTDFDIQNSDV
jgi:hypothetical protein